MSKITIIKGNYAGYKIKIDNTLAQQLPSLDLAKERAKTLAQKYNQTSIEIFDEDQELIENYIL
ncbi:hypothetical protein SCLARK_001206 [Spiroplasma clarkii]|uniref:Uncharacterized protein n=1 Tax=Spiroplasma clarkii TaxID=2139 RepID=A0A1Y0L189_9MOLU|nr:hypothetical protein [Spiroplasma clarkii]ARU91763.1 hypothetical protein SCLARK_001206 [Spiroplasma clarkii]ATX71135.1 hypothetical protein SCLAR_v1c08230 [Spiroplasma clarkii]